mmetsp:Transcript_10908/g.23989  ORF Transcript_10908/g.23989 Transcript_10908/m.23989 type:complete len:207 (-) Transcript_10908:1351-1971(-)
MNCSGSTSMSNFSDIFVRVAPPPKAMAPSPFTPGGSFDTYSAADFTTCSCTSLMGRAGIPLARSAITSAANLPARVAPSIDPRNFWEVKHPHKVRLGMGVVWLGRYLLRPGMAAYTLLGTLTTAYFFSLACPAGPCFDVAGHFESQAISVGKSRASSPMVASMISSSFLAIQLVFPPAIGEHGANTNSSIDASSSAYSLQVMDISA